MLLPLRAKMYFDNYRAFLRFC